MYRILTEMRSIWETENEEMNMAKQRAIFIAFPILYSSLVKTSTRFSRVLVFTKFYLGVGQKN